MLQTLNTLGGFMLGGGCLAVLFLLIFKRAEMKEKTFYDPRSYRNLFGYVAMSGLFLLMAVGILGAPDLSPVGKAVSMAVVIGIFSFSILGFLQFIVTKKWKYQTVIKWTLLAIGASAIVRLLTSGM